MHTIIKKNLKKLIIITIAFTYVNIYAQNSTVSPYSGLGLGDALNSQFIQNGIKGYQTMALGDSLNMSMYNPATLGFIRQTGFHFGAWAAINRQSFNDKVNDKGLGNFDYAAISFPILKRKSKRKLFGLNDSMHRMAAMISLNPQTAIGYDHIAENIADTMKPSTVFKGNGGLATFKTSLAYSFGNNFSLGYTLNYSFGQNSKSRIMLFADHATTTKIIEDYENNYFKGFSHTFGFQKKFTTKNLHHNFGGSFSPKSSFNNDYYRLVKTFPFTRNPIFDTILIDKIPNGNITYPSAFGIGYNITYKHKFGLSAEYNQQNWSEYTSGSTSAGELNDKKTIKLGFYKEPIITKKYKKNGKTRTKIGYGMGFYSTSPQTLKLTDGSISNLNEYGINFGVSIPMVSRSAYSVMERRSLISLLNISVEYVNRSTKSNLLLNEQYFKIKAGMSFSDLWFKRIKIR